MDVVGDLLEGRVASLKPCGAFIDIGNGVVSLLHISEISRKRISSVEEILRVGERIKVLVLKLDQQRRHVNLSTKELEQNPGDMLRNPQLVFDKAEEMAEAILKRDAKMKADAEACLVATLTGLGPSGNLPTQGLLAPAC
ncbi:hypothetical protein FOA52_002982 [Chlamydomonas sp. UWO 241]|nr:hypothetical protein FOA52_002982 [Chlamydomonas sp. UWO 241]